MSVLTERVQRALASNEGAALLAKIEAEGAAATTQRREALMRELRQLEADSSPQFADLLAKIGKAQTRVGKADAEWRAALNNFVRLGGCTTTSTNR